IKMESMYDYLKIYRIKNEVLHAKVLVADGETTLVGSANPTFGGMVRNYELGFLVEDQKISHKILTILGRLKEG
ncbi:MAG: phospholipase D family protein, partial [Nanoarchaeota archaeon]|nr:phospholipase D family protein [Nanoarchaeota archaeon]